MFSGKIAHARMNCGSKFKKNYMTFHTSVKDWFWFGVNDTPDPIVELADARVHARPAGQCALHPIAHYGNLLCAGMQVCDQNYAG
jgi:hypothetical protein